MQGCSGLWIILAGSLLAIGLAVWAPGNIFPVPRAGPGVGATLGEVGIDFFQRLPKVLLPKGPLGIVVTPPFIDGVEFLLQHQAIGLMQEAFLRKDTGILVALDVALHPTFKGTK